MHITHTLKRHTLNAAKYSNAQATEYPSSVFQLNGKLNHKVNDYCFISPYLVQLLVIFYLVYNDSVLTSRESVK